MHPQSTLEAAELIAERPDERLDTIRLEPYLRAHLPGADGKLSVAQFHGGKANLTYLLRFGAKEFVLRRPPLGPIPPGALAHRRACTDCPCPDFAHSWQRAAVPDHPPRWIALLKCGHAAPMPGRPEPGVAA